MNGISTGGPFSEEEKTIHDHINKLELHAVLLDLSSPAKEIENTHIKIMCDNSTTVACINKFGSTNSDPCNLLAKNFWSWAIPKINYLSCTNIPGK